MFRNARTYLLFSLFSYLTDFSSWRVSLYICGIFSLALAFALLWAFNNSEKLRIIPLVQSKETIKPSIKQLFQNVFFNKLIWTNGLYAFFLYSIITVFYAVWAVPYTEKLYQITTTQSAFIINFINLGLGFASLFLAWFVTKVGLAKTTRMAPLLSLPLIILYIYFPPGNLFISCLLMFLVGLGCSSYQLVFSIVNQNTTRQYQNIANGLTNMILMSSALSLQPLVGIILSSSQGGILDGSETYTIMQHRAAFLIIPLSLFFSFLFSLFILPKKPNNHGPLA